MVSEASVHGRLAPPWDWGEAEPHGGWRVDQSCSAQGARKQEAGRRGGGGMRGKRHLQRPTPGTHHLPTAPPAKDQALSTKPWGTFWSQAITTDRQHRTPKEGPSRSTWRETSR